MPEEVINPGGQPAAPAAPAPAPTPAEIEAQRADFMTGFVNNPRWNQRDKTRLHKGDPKTPENPEAPAGDPANPPPVAPAPVEPPVAEPVVDPNDPPIVVPERANTDSDPEPDDVQARVDAEVATRLAAAGLDASGNRLNQPSTESAPQGDRVGAHELAVFDAMERLNPRYVGLRQRVEDFWKLDAAYRRKWITEHPGEKFNSDAEEHAGFYQANEPEFSKRDHEFAQRQVERASLAAETREQVMRELEPELKQLRVDKQMRKIEPEIKKVASEAKVSVLAGVPEFEAAMKDGKGNLVFTAEKEKAMREANPILFDLAEDENDKAMAVVVEIEKMNKLGRDYVMNERFSVELPSGEVIRPHAIISDTHAEIEESILRAPEADRIYKGKSFITIAERRFRINQIAQLEITDAAKQARIDQLKSAHWTVDASDVKRRIIAKSRKRLETLAAKIPTSALKSREQVTPKPGQSSQPATPPKPAAAPASSSGSDTVSSSDVVNTRIHSGKDSNSIAGVLF